MDTSAAETFGQPQTTRFAPSPTGELHLGNARTALFNYLLARHQAGRFLLRIEDTDAERSKEQHTAALIEDLKWLGMSWDAGPDREDAKGPYRQSQRRAFYDRYFAELEKRNAVYPCYCTPLELEASRRAQLASGRPPRYAGTCRELSAEQREQKSRRGFGADHAVPRATRTPHRVRGFCSRAAELSSPMTSVISSSGALTGPLRFSFATRWTMLTWVSPTCCEARIT